MSTKNISQIELKDTDEDYDSLPTSTTKFDIQKTDKDLI